VVVQCIRVDSNTSGYQLMNPSTLQATWATQDPSTAGDASRRVHFQNPLQQARRATQEDGDTLQGALAGDTGRRQPSRRKAPSPGRKVLGFRTP
jgi:hypothetical protein